MSSEGRAVEAKQRKGGRARGNSLQQALVDSLTLMNP